MQTDAAIIIDAAPHSQRKRTMRQRIFGFAAVMAVALVPSSALAQQQRQQATPQAAQPQKPAKDLLPGSWSLLIIDGVKDDGTHVPFYGPNPEGILIFAPDGHFSVNIMRSGRAPFASNNVLAGTADENKATVQGSFGFFGRYTVDNNGKTLTYHVDGSEFPNLDNTTQKADVTALTDEVLTFNFRPATPGFTHGEAVWEKLK
jgi:hypothetical protein